MSNAKNWGAALVFVALVAAATPSAYQLLVSGAASPDSAESRTGREVERPGGAPGAGVIAAGRDSEERPANGAAPRGYARDGGKSSEPWIGVMPRNRLPGGGFHYDARLNGGDGVDTPAAALDSMEEGAPGTFIVLFDEPALATYQGGTAGIAMPPRHLHASGKSGLDGQSVDAQNYLGYLQGRQLLMEEQMASVAGRELEVRHRMQHAVNGIVVDLTAQESQLVAAMPGVALVEGYREYAANTDVGPTLIGAPQAWAGTAGLPGGAAAVQGEGIVVGMIDSGINFGSPSFAATDPVDGYVHVNPLGSGVYLGTCLAGGDDAGRCNDKLIGGYDFVCAAPGNQCGVANVREEPGFGDSNSHGSHTASIAAGNRRDVVVDNAPLRISGVAPRASLMAYDACYTDLQEGSVLCPNVSTVAAINQAVADGVDVINYSIAGGASPWTEATSLAFLNANAAGIYVATSAGNDTPYPRALDHLEPWTSTTASSQHGRARFGTLMQVTGPTPVPAGLQPVVLNGGSGGIAFSATLPGNTPLRVSSGINTTTDGCSPSPYAAGSLTGAVVVIRRGGCDFTVKVNNASAAGAIAVIIANDRGGTLRPSAPGTTVPVFGARQVDGNALVAFGSANPSTATAQITFPGVGLPNVADALAASSSRGPAGSFDLLKPDVTAPGVQILGALAGPTITGSEQLIGVFSGTSLASAHNAGAAVLLRQARPSWTAAEIKSALMMTATTQVLLEDEITPANAFARGSGRLRIERAIRAGLVLNETTANFTAANPDSGGDTSSLNLPSMARADCHDSCQFVRTFRNPGTSGALWSLSVTGLTGTLDNSLIWVPAGASRSVTVTIDTSAFPADGAFHFGQLVMVQRLSGAQTSSNVLTLPIAVAAVPPIVSVPTAVSASVVAGNSGSTSFDVRNVGRAPLDYAITPSGSGSSTLYMYERSPQNTTFSSTLYTDSGASPSARFAAEDFDLGSTTQILSLSVEGNFSSGVSFPAGASAVSWSIYPDANGVPAGNPKTAPGAAVWTYTTTPTGAGVGTAGASLSLDLLAASQNVVLPAGKYWLVVNTTSPAANDWGWYVSDTGDGSMAWIAISETNTGTWTDTKQFVNLPFRGFSMRIVGLVPCGAPWLGGVTPPSGSLAPGGVQSSNVTLNSPALAAGTYGAYLCVNSNDPVTPSAAVRINLSVTP